MPTKFPAPAEVLAHPQGHLVHSVRPHYAKKKNKEQKLEDREITHYTVLFYLENYPFYGSFGWNPELSRTPVMALEAGLAAAIADKMEHPGNDYVQKRCKIGRHTPAKRKTAKDRRLEKEAYAKKMTDQGFVPVVGGGWRLDMPTTTAIVSKCGTATTVTHK